ncbi:cation diffusion facilitator family transporter [Methanosarcina sp.]|uniref:cation diffusion facilitator family transporter n=1 Tax=Methanosarcina sp. TaxID=2213 RepID=UPI0029890FCD|nr:cation diffusion facilitator family transporter [Methanosarcina sp.]MDW5550377.1 cation diffusion facilitator family transporter [Methanosarcina sp.]MDW5554701.1 cation diffusion facilitator family transporter [Methanosarcina sp.]MDW5560488.1 cation diffusion facilitator family transporter [Methanosarcina sp.]
MGDREKNVGLAAALNILFTVIELIGGFLTNSLALIADALHDFADSFALIIAWYAEKKAKKPATSKMTFGYRRLSLLSATFTIIVLVTGSLFVLTQAIPRLISPEPVNAEGMVLIAVIGVTINGLGYFRLKKGMSQSEKVLSWHLLEDILGWVVLLTGSIIMRFWNKPVIDPIMTIGFTVFVLWGVSKNAKEVLNLLLEGVPEYIDIDEIKKSILSVEGVKIVHDLHVWSLEGETDLLTSHVVVENKYLQTPDKMRQAIKSKLEEHHIEHSTLELESEGLCSGKECIFESKK